MFCHFFSEMKMGLGSNWTQLIGKTLVSCTIAIATRNTEIHIDMSHWHQYRVHLIRILLIDTP